MNFKVEILQEAIDEIVEAYTWYEDQQEGLGKLLINTLDDYFELLADNPLLFQVASGNERVAVIKKFPYKIVYRIEAEVVIILSIFHTSRDPK